MKNCLHNKFNYSSGGGAQIKSTETWRTSFTDLHIFEFELWKVFNLINEVLTGWGFFRLILIGHFAGCRDVDLCATRCPSTSSRDYFGSRGPSIHLKWNEFKLCCFVIKNHHSPCHIVMLATCYLSCNGLSNGNNSAGHTHWSSNSVNHNFTRFYYILDF